MHKERPLLSLRLKLTATLQVSASLYRDDTPATLADRLMRLHPSLLSSKRALLTTLLEREVNLRIREMREAVERDVLEIKRNEREREQAERERRLEEARGMHVMNTAKRAEGVLEKRVLGRLKVLIGAKRSGEIVVREGDSVRALAKGFVAAYGLKKEFVEKIVESLE